MDLLFQTIPDTLFNVLSSPKKELYAQALFILKNAMENNISITKKEYIEMLTDYLSPLLSEYDFIEESKDFCMELNNTFDNRKKSLLLFQKLKKDEWFDVEYALNSTEEYISLPEYAAKLIDSLYEIATRSMMQEYNSPVYATYAALMMTQKKHPEQYFHAMTIAYNNSHELEKNLKQCLNGINWHINHDLKESSLNELLHTMFGDEKGFQEEIIDKLYYPIKTRDSIPKYKETIIETLTEWLNDPDIIDCIISRGINQNVYQNYEEGIQHAIQMMNDVIRIYETIHLLIEQIDSKLNNYISRMTDLIHYKNNQDSGIKSILYRILTNEDMVSALGSECSLYTSNFIDSTSIYKKVDTSKKEPSNSKPLNTNAPKPKEDAFTEYKRKVLKKRKQKQEYLQHNFDGKSKFTSKDVKMETKKDFVQFLLCVEDGFKKNSEYDVIIKKEMINNNGAKIPFIEFVKKEGNNV